MKIVRIWKQFKARAQVLQLAFFSLFLLPGLVISPHGINPHNFALSTLSNDNPLLKPIFDFFGAIWDNLSKLVSGLTDAINNWFSAVWNVQWNDIPVGPVIFIGLIIISLAMIWGFFKLRQFTRTD